jgi:hypothetical protein
MRRAIVERDEMRRANVTPEDADRPLGQSVRYWQDRCLDHATALDDARQRLRGAVEAGDAMASAIERRWTGPGGCSCEVCESAKAWRAHRVACGDDLA